MDPQSMLQSFTSFLPQPRGAHRLYQDNNEEEVCLDPRAIYPQHDYSFQNATAVPLEPPDDYDLSINNNQLAGLPYFGSRNANKLSISADPIGYARSSMQLGPQTSSIDTGIITRSEIFRGRHAKHTSTIPVQNDLPNWQGYVSGPSSHMTQSSPAAQVRGRRGVQIAQEKSSRALNDFETQSEIATLNLPHAPSLKRLSQPESGGPVINGQVLVKTSQLCDRIKSVFPYRLFNAVQSTCFDEVFESDENFVMTAPTGSGKTVILEFAICRLIISRPCENFRIVYMAPTKSLCTERLRDWSFKFRSLSLSCTEVTGDTATAGLISQIERSHIIITTPEKWDSVTRKWNDNKDIMKSVKLFLIDEVHLLGDSRGPTLEVVVSRMKSMGGGVRFVAVSATVPNAEDVAGWLGKSSECPDQPANKRTFGEELRPVKLDRHVHGVRGYGSEYQTDEACNKRIPDIIHCYTRQQPILIFCFTKKSCLATATLLTKVRKSDRRARNWWRLPQRIVQVSDANLKELVPSGVAVHHGDISTADRTAVETGFLNGDIKIVCCTSTLAVGVNLPCHMVIVKNTVVYTDEGFREYTDVEIMQMIGRAGRPQFDTDGAVAVIVTDQRKAERYEQLVSGQKPLESRLHSSLIEHVNAEIGLGTITDSGTAMKWLRGTFLYVRLCKNPSGYRFEGFTQSKSLAECIMAICQKDVNTLVKNKLVSRDVQGLLRCTRLGEAMARYYVSFHTMQKIFSIPEGCGIPDILTALATFDEFSGIKLRRQDQKTYQILNKSPGILFPFDKVERKEQKISIIVQVDLGGVNPPIDAKSHRINLKFLQERTIIFNNIHRLIRCVIDCKIHKQDGLSVRNSLELARSLSARVWETSPLQMQQIPGIGPVTIRKLVQAGIISINMLEDTDPGRISMILGKSRQGENLYQELRKFPRLRITVSFVEYQKAAEGPPIVTFKVQSGFLNSRTPDTFAKKPIFICMVAERSDNLLVDFRRMRSSKVEEPVFLQTEIEDEQQFITCHVMCDEIVGTLQRAELRPRLPIELFPPGGFTKKNGRNMFPKEVQMNTSRKRSRAQGEDSIQNSDSGSQNELFFPISPTTEAQLLEAEKKLKTRHINDIESIDLSSDKVGLPSEPQLSTERTRQRADGKYECGHPCKDKSKCRHFCCRDGVLKPPRRNKEATTNVQSNSKAPLKFSATQKSVGGQQTEPKRQASNPLSQETGGMKTRSNKPRTKIDGVPLAFRDEQPVVSKAGSYNEKGCLNSSGSGEDPEYEQYLDVIVGTNSNSDTPHHAAAAMAFPRTPLPAVTSYPQLDQSNQKKDMIQGNSPHHEKKILSNELLDPWHFSKGGHLLVGSPESASLRHRNVVQSLPSEPPLVSQGIHEDNFAQNKGHEETEKSSSFPDTSIHKNMRPGDLPKDDGTTVSARSSELYSNIQNNRLVNGKKLYRSPVSDMRDIDLDVIDEFSQFVDYADD